MRLNARHLLWLIAVAIVAAIVLLLLVRPPVAAPRAGDQPSSPAIHGQDVIPTVDPEPWVAVEWQALEEPFAADEPPLIRMDGVADGRGLVIGWGRASTPARAADADR